MQERNEKIGRFEILYSFKIIGRGLVVVGKICEGQVKVGSLITFHIGESCVTKQIGGVGMTNNPSGESHVGLTLVYTDPDEMKEHENLKLNQQLVDIMNDD